MTIILGLTKLVLLDSKKVDFDRCVLQTFYYDRIDLSEGNDIVQILTVTAMKTIPFVMVAII